MLLVRWQEGHLACKKTEWRGAGVVVCLERDADLHIAQLMPLTLTVSCFSKVEIGFTFLVRVHSVSSGQRAVKWVCVCVCVIALTCEMSPGACMSGIASELAAKHVESEAALVPLVLTKACRDLSRQISSLTRLQSASASRTSCAITTIHAAFDKLRTAYVLTIVGMQKSCVD